MFRFSNTDGNLLGIETAVREIERTSLAESAASNELVSDMMSTKVVTVKASDKVSRALHAMVRHKIGSVVVVEKRKPVGILTERDVSTRVAKGQNVRDMLVRRIMSKPLATICPSAEVWEAVEQMVRKGIRQLPVIEGEKLVGIITERDVFRWVIIIAYEPNIPEDVRRLVESR